MRLLFFLQVPNWVTTITTSRRVIRSITSCMQVSDNWRKMSQRVLPGGQVATKTIVKIMKIKEVGYLNEQFFNVNKYEITLRDLLSVDIESVHQQNLLYCWTALNLARSNFFC